MRQRLVRRYATAPLAAVLALAISSCSAGVQAGTLDPQHLSGAKAQAGQLKIRNAIVVANVNDVAAAEASMVVTIINDGSTDDSLVGIVLTGPNGAVDVTIRPATVDLPPESSTVIPGAAARPVITVDQTNIEVGAYLSATFSFEIAGSTTVPVLALSSAAVYGGN